MHKDHDRTRAVRLDRRVSEGPMNSRHTTTLRRTVSLDHTIYDQVRHLRMAVSDLQIQVKDLAAHRE